MNSEEIKQQTTMYEVLGRYGLSVGRSGMICCPFHGERHPSMKIYKDGYNCFACGLNGDIFGFVMEMERCDFKTAFQILGGTYENQDPLDRKIRNTAFKRRAEEKERSDKMEADFRKTLARTITVCRRVIEICEPMGDMWTDAQNWLPELLYIWELKYLSNENDEKVDELNVYRKCRAINARFGVG